MFHFIALMILIILGQACGTDDSSDKQATVATSSDTPHALALKDKEDLPDCGEENQNQLVYLTKEKLFFTCDDAEWTEINIQVAHKAEAEKESVFSDSVWTDKKTNKKWIVVGMREQAGDTCAARAVGSTGSENYMYHATSDDIREALRNGIFKGYNLPIWLNDDTNTIVYSDFPSVDLSGRVNAQAVMLCRLREPK